MPGTTIGQSMLFGFPGTFARNADCIIMARPVKATDAVGPAFGTPVILNADNTYSAFGAAGTAAAFAGVAVREVNQAITYTAQNIGGYAPGQPCDVIERGAVSVICNVGNPTAGGDIYVRVADNAGIPTGVIGGFEAAADGANTVNLTNCKWATGQKDANNVTELPILNRNNP